MAETQQDRIVVGVEGSGGSVCALKWAIGEAKARNASVDVVTAYSDTFVASSPDFNYMPLEPLDLEGEIVKMQENIVKEEISAEDKKGVEINYCRMKGRPSDVLIKASDDAEMLVVGSRGRGGFKGLLLGSISQQVVQHATCPVVIIKPGVLEEE